MDYVIYNGQPKTKKEFTMQVMPVEFIHLKDKQQQVLAFFKGKKMHAFAAIGHPERFFKALRDLDIEIIEHAYPDHYVYQAKDFDLNDDLPIMMTEKDAVKCESFADDRFWSLSIKLQLSEGFKERFLDSVSSYRGLTAVSSK